MTNHDRDMTIPDTARKVVDLAETGADQEQALRFSRIRNDRPGAPAVLSMGNQDADYVVLFLEDVSLEVDYGKDLTFSRLARSRDCILHNMRPPQKLTFQSDVDLLIFDISTEALDRWTRENGFRAVGGLRYDDGVLRRDEVIEGFGSALLPYLDDPKGIPRLFVDHVLNAVCLHLVRSYGAPRSEARGIGGLAPWQERRAKEQIDAKLDGQISLKDLADGCGLSVSHFARAFRATVGMPPHQWLLQRRIERSIKLLKEGRLPIVQIAAACGFSDQSHFTRAFAKSVGEAPGAWRRAQGHRWGTPGLGSSRAEALVAA